MTLPPNPRKRRSRDWELPQAQHSTQPTCKRQKRADVSSPLPLQFWDNLSTIHLTAAALQELDRRHSATSVSGRRYITRGFANLNKKPQQSVPTGTPLQHHCVGITNGLRRFARHGGPDMSAERGHRLPSNAPQRSKSTRRVTSRAPTQNPTPTSSDHPSGQTSSIRSTGPYNRNFQQHLIDHDIFPDGYEYPDGRVPSLPRNWAEINERLRIPRRSLSPSIFKEEDFKKFKKADDHASKEQQVTTSVIPVIEGSIKDDKCTTRGIPFRNLDPLTDGTLVPGNPDIYYGARPEQLDRRVRQELNGLIVPSTQDDLPVAPNFFLAAKGPDGMSTVALRQACYDGALGARGMDKLRSYGETQPISSGDAFTITSTYHSSQMKMYTIHCIKSAEPGNHAEYYMHQLRSFAMTDSYDTFRQGATAYRNARDWAEEQRNTAIDRANGIIFMTSTESVSASTPAASTRADDEPNVLEIREDTSSQDSARYTTPPSGEQTSCTTFEATSSTTPSNHTTSELDTTKRTRQHLQGSSPMQNKRHRKKTRDHSSSPILSVTTASANTGLSFRFEDQALEQGDENE